MNKAEAKIDSQIWYSIKPQDLESQSLGVRKQSFKIDYRIYRFNAETGRDGSTETRTD